MSKGASPLALSAGSLYGFSMDSKLGRCALPHSPSARARFSKYIPCPVMLMPVCT